MNTFARALGHDREVFAYSLTDVTCIERRGIRGRMMDGVWLLRVLMASAFLLSSDLPASSGTPMPRGHTVSQSSIRPCIHGDWN